MNKYILIFFVVFISFGKIFAQSTSEFDASYEVAIQQYKNGAYERASMLFTPLLDINAKNTHSIEAKYFKAMCLFNLNKSKDAAQQFQQLLNTHANWKNIEDVYYMLGVIAFQNDDIFVAMDFLKYCKSIEIYSDAFQLKKTFLNKEASIYKLKVLNQKHPDDEALAIILATKLSAKEFLLDEEKMLLQYLKQTFVFDNELKAKIAELENKGAKKSYNIAVLFPFQYTELKKFNVQNNSQFVVDLYNGVSIGISELNKENQVLNLITYDTKNDPNELKRIVALPEFSNIDLILGPIYKEENHVASEYCNQKNVVKVNPLSTTPFASDSTFGFYMSPSVLTLGQNAAQFCFDSISKTNIFIAGYNDSKDSIFINGFTSRFKILGGKKVTVRYFGKYEQILTTLESLNLDTTNTKVIVAYNPNSKLVSNLCSYYNVKRFKIPFLTTINFVKSEQFLATSFSYSSLYCLDPSFSYSAITDTFKTNYFQKYGFPASSDAIMGYEMAMFYGKQLLENGTFFYQKLKAKSENTQGTLYPYFNYYNSNSNTFTPILKMDQYVLIPQNFNEQTNEPNE